MSRVRSTSDKHPRQRTLHGKRRGRWFGTSTPLSSAHPAQQLRRGLGQSDSVSFHSHGDVWVASTGACPGVAVVRDGKALPNLDRTKAFNHDLRAALRRPDAAAVRSGDTDMVLPITVEDVRLFLHVLAASVWVGGQITLAGLVPVLRKAGVDVPRSAARQFNRIAWPAFGVLILTGIWNISADHDELNHESGFRGTLWAKLAMVVLSGLVGLPPHASEDKGSQRDLGSRDGACSPSPPSSSGWFSRTAKSSSNVTNLCSGHCKTCFVAANVVSVSGRRRTSGRLR